MMIKRKSRKRTSLNKITLKIFKTLIVLYILICIALFFFQEKLIFFPDKLEKNFQFSFENKFEELNVKTKDGKLLNGILFKSDSSKGLIFYLHGNAGSLNSWGDVAKTYTDLNYDVFIIDYRGFGKSEGSIENQGQLFDDLQIAFNVMKEKYAEDKIIVLGYSIGTGLAAKIASVNHPKLLILQAPYYSLTDMMKHDYPIIPTFILKYKFDTYKYIENCNMPIVIFHGNADEVIYYNSSIKLKALLKKSDKLITLNGQGHNGITDNPVYIEEIKKILN
jgi:pimeloyl-ACP methyl ester carboxylesterase